jgi:2-methylcitrate synthase
MNTEAPVIHHGLDGVVVDTTAISKVMPEINSLVYRGYPVQELAERCTFEEVAWLIWHGELPSKQELADFMEHARRQRGISQDLVAVIQKIPRTAHPMDVLRTAVSFLGTEDTELNKTDAATNLKRSISMTAKIPTMIAAFYRFRKGQDFIPPREDLRFVDNFFNMVFGKVPAPEVVKAFEVSMIL